MMDIKEDIRVELSFAGEVGISNPKAREGLPAGTMVSSGVRSEGVSELDAREEGLQAEGRA